MSRADGTCGRKRDGVCTGREYDKMSKRGEYTRVLTIIAFNFYDPKWL